MGSEVPQTSISFKWLQYVLIGTGCRYQTSTKYKVRGTICNWAIYLLIPNSVAGWSCARHSGIQIERAGAKGDRTILILCASGLQILYPRSTEFAARVRRHKHLTLVFHNAKWPTARCNSQRYEASCTPRAITDIKGGVVTVDMSVTYSKMRNQTMLCL